jgi:hypothetical protein
MSKEDANQDVLRINMFFLTFTKYATKLAEYDTGWKKYLKMPAKFFYFKKMRKEIEVLVQRVPLYDLIVDLLELNIYFTDTHEEEFKEYENMVSKYSSGNYYRAIQSPDKKKLESFEINIETQKLSINIKNLAKPGTKENKNLQITLTAHKLLKKTLTKETGVNFTVYNNGMVSSEYEQLYKNAEEMIRSYIFGAIMHNTTYMIPKIVWGDLSDSRQHTRKQIREQK